MRDGIWRSSCAPRAAARAAAALAAALLALAAAPAGGGGGERAFKIGFDVRNTQVEDARQYQPFLEYLAEATGYRFELRFTRKGESIVELLGTGGADFAFVGAQSYLEARERYGARALARGLNRQGKAEYRSAIVTRQDSPIRQVADLRGRSFAFGSRTSTQGHLIPLIVLSEHGMAVGDLGRNAFTGSHRNCAQAVLKGEFEAGAMQDALAEEYAAAGLLRVVHLSRLYPSSGVAAAAGVPRAVAERVGRALVAFRPGGAHGKKLYNWDKTEMPNGFVAADDADYAELRAHALRFGLLRGPAP